MPRHRKKIIDAWGAIIVFTFAALEILVWKSIISGIKTEPSEISFLNVRQGESALAIFPHNIKIMTDAGPDAAVNEELSKIIPSSDTYIDLAIVSYPDPANYEGYFSLLDHYTIGSFVYDGRSDDIDSASWQALLDKIEAKHIPLITLGAGDSIRYGNDEIDVLAPDKDFSRSAEPNGAAIVQRMITPEFRAILASDIGTNEETLLLSQNPGILRADIVKAPFPSSGTAADSDFLRAIAPKIVAVTPGIKNTASQPSKTELASLASSTNGIVLDIDQSGTTEIVPVGGKLLLYNK